MTRNDWYDLQYMIATAIDDSVDDLPCVEWSTDVAARAVVDMLKAEGYIIKSPLEAFGEDPNL